MKTWKNADVVVLNINETANGNIFDFEEIHSDGSLVGDAFEFLTYLGTDTTTQTSTSDFGKEEATTGSRS